MKRRQCTNLATLVIVPLLLGSKPGLAARNAAVQRPTGMKNCILAAFRLVGNQILDKPVLVRTKKNRGNIVVSFDRPTSNTMIATGRKPIKNLVQLEFTGASIRIIPAEFVTDGKDQSQDTGLYRVAELGCKRLLDRHIEQSEFELEIRRNGRMYTVTMTSVPYVPDGYATTDIVLLKGKLIVR